MKKIILFSIYCLLWSLTGNAQRIALIDMEYILENIPAYQKANNELEQLSQQYQKAIEAKSQEAEFLYKTYQKTANTMSATQRSQKEEAIVAKEKEVMELRQKYFGNEGEMRKKEEALIMPIQNQIYETVKEISMQKGYDIVIDRASANSMIYASPKIDISNEILRKLGYSK
jgi:outer membrane protein